MAMASFNISISYSQIVVFDSTLTKPFSTWTEEHVNQGFAWRNGSASFRTVASGGRHLINVKVSEEVSMSQEAVRIIQIPFEVPVSGAIEVGSVSDSYPLQLPAGLYALRYEGFRSFDRDPMINLFFLKDMNPKFEVLRADAELDLPEELITNASAA